MLVEICIDCIDSAAAAQAGGAHRIEVCGSLSAGGITPSVGLIGECVDRCSIPSMVMIRPHDGGFVYSDADIDLMLRDIDVVISMGVKGVVLGALTQDGRVDVPAMQRLVDASRPLEITFHRAFDVVKDPFRALDDIINLGIERLLTSGQAATADSGSNLIKQLVERSGDRVSVIAGAGIDSKNAQKVVSKTRVKEVHASASVPRFSKHQLCDRSRESVSFGDHSRVTTTERVRELVSTLTKDQSNTVD